LGIKLFEKESLIKGFSLFFIVIELFLLFIFYNYYRLEEEHLSEELFLEMKNYSFFFDDKRFDMDIVPKVEESQLYELYFDNKNLYILVPLFDDTNNSLEIFYPLPKYKSQLKDIQETLLIQFLLLSIIAILISTLFAFYALHPLRNAIILLEEFIKDIIHDLNTPITSILINLKMMKKSEEVDSIAQSTNAIAMLHKNLIVYLKDTEFKKDKVFIKEVIQEQIKFFNLLYDYLEWRVDIDNETIISNKTALSRVVYNLLSNACKYNRTDGFIEIKMKNSTLSIINSSYGIKNPSKVFNRFYKESDRGLGIGLHIVDKLCKELGIERKLEVINSNDEVRVTLDFRVNI
jgi:two-component system OmpR family sensor kinase